MVKLLTGILFSTALTAVAVVAKLVMLGLLYLTSFILALRLVLVAGLLSFSLYHLAYLNQQEQHVVIYQHLIYLLYFSNC